MSSRPELKVDWCTHEAAKYAVEHWHYSRRMPVFKLVRIGVWEDRRFIGCVLFGSGATPEIASPFGLDRLAVCELVRIALTKHVWPVTRIVKIAIALLHRVCPGVRLVVSFADSAQGHHGGIYAGGNWVYIGAIPHHAYRVNGEVVHPKTLHSRYGIGGQSVPWLRQHVDPDAERIKTEVKHKYLYPLDAAMRAQIEPLRKPYPKRAGSVASDTPANQAGEGGATPTPALCVTK